MAHEAQMEKNMIGRYSKLYSFVKISQILQVLVFVQKWSFFHCIHFAKMFNNIQLLTMPHIRFIIGMLHIEGTIQFLW